MPPNTMDKQTPEDPYGYLNGLTRPNEEAMKKQTIGEHPQSQAEILLSKPIVIPRNPWALIAPILTLVGFADLAFAILDILLMYSFASSAQTSAVALGIILLFLKSCLVLGIIFKMAMEWVPDSYELTERQLVKRKGVANKEDKVYELANIRHVSVRQNFVGRQLEYGDIELLIATAGLNETIRLTDVKDPVHFEEVFKQYLG